MKARIKQEYDGGLYWGEVYHEGLKRWKTVTYGCLTKCGAEKELKRYKKEHTGIVCEFDL